MIDAEVMKRVLREVARRCETLAWNVVRERVAREHGRFEPLVEWVIAEYSDPARRRWYDPLHIAYSTQFALDLVSQGQADPLVIPAILLHDMGYFAIRDKEAWNRPEARVTHMQEGAALAAEVLARLGYSPTELGRVVGMVATHDNPYLGYPLQGPDRLALRDCDRVWVMHLVSFYKDWTSKREPDRNTDIRRLLEVRRVHFLGEDAGGGDSAVWEEARERIERPTLATTRSHIGRLLERRRKELDDPRFWRADDGLVERVTQVVLEE